MHFLSPTQVGTLAAAINERFRCAIITDAYTGLRAGELWALNVSRIQLRTIEVVESLSEVGGELQTGPTKTGERRTVSLPRFLAEMLAEHIRRYPSRDGYVFTAPAGGPVRHHNFVKRHFRHAVEAAGDVPDDLRFHDLRHTCAAILIAEGWSPKQIQQRLGHASIRTTLDRYGHLFEGHDQALLDSLDATLRENAKSDSDQIVTKQESVVDLEARRESK
jgi:integrase